MQRLSHLSIFFEGGTFLNSQCITWKFSFHSSACSMLTANKAAIRLQDDEH